jgi:hypothetical protein
MDTIFGTWKTVEGEWKKPQTPPSKTLLYRKRLQHAGDLQRRSYPVPQPLSIYSSYESGSQLNSLHVRGQIIWKLSKGDKFQNLEETEKKRTEV